VKNEDTKELGRAFGAGQAAFGEVRDWLGWKFYLIPLVAIVIGSVVKSWTGSGVLAFCIILILGAFGGAVTRLVWRTRKNRTGPVD